MAEPLLRIEGLSVSFRADRRHWNTVVRSMGLTLNAGQVLCLVGESGCGKSVTASSILRLLPRDLARVDSGSIRYEGKELTTLRDREMRAVRGGEIAMIFQDPLTSLNPVQRVGKQMMEMLRAHSKEPDAALRRQAAEMLHRVGIPEPESRLEVYPFQLSGGMIQRVMIAMALSVSPRLLIADEPTTALDVTIQAQVLELMRHLRDETGMALLLITHDMGVVAEMADDVLVMYAGEMVEYGPVAQLLEHPLHPYTRGLLDALPRLDQQAETLTAIPGQVPPPIPLPGCRFAERCPRVQACCRIQPPPVVETQGRRVRCHLASRREGEQHE